MTAFGRNGLPARCRRGPARRRQARCRGRARSSHHARIVRARRRRVCGNRHSCNCASAQACASKSLMAWMSGKSELRGQLVEIETPVAVGQRDLAAGDRSGYREHGRLRASPVSAGTRDRVRTANRRCPRNDLFRAAVGSEQAKRLCVPPISASRTAVLPEVRASGPEAARKRACRSRPPSQVRLAGAAGRNRDRHQRTLSRCRPAAGCRRHRPAAVFLFALGDQGVAAVGRHQREDRVGRIARLIGEIDPRVGMPRQAAREDRDQDMRRLRLAVRPGDSAGLDRAEAEAAFGVGAGSGRSRWNFAFGRACRRDARSGLRRRPARSRSWRR